MQPAASLLDDKMYLTQTKNYYEDLQIAGKELILNGAIPVELNSKLHEQWIDAETYIKLANDYFSAEIKRNKITK